MAGIFKKFRDLGLASIHSLLDKAIDLNSVAVVKQHVRDLENALSELENGAAEAAGYVRTLNREAIEL
ncbi:MAG: PspA/IM30 family protein, partial [Patescibacteria group bacterium]